MEHGRQVTQREEREMGLSTIGKIDGEEEKVQ